MPCLQYGAISTSTCRDRENSQVWRAHLQQRPVPYCVYLRPGPYLRAIAMLPVRLLPSRASAMRCGAPSKAATSGCLPTPGHISHLRLRAPAAAFALHAPLHEPSPCHLPSGMRPVGMYCRPRRKENTKCAAASSGAMPMPAQPSKAEGASFVQAVFNVVNVVMGVGLLTLPFALKSSGWIGLVLLWTMGFVTNYTGEGTSHRQQPLKIHTSLVIAFTRIDALPPVRINGKADRPSTCRRATGQLVGIHMCRHYC